MSAPISHATPPIAASQNATAATASSPGSSANVAAGSVQPTARSYASATKKVSSPPIASSAAPPVAVGGSQNPKHGKNPSISPVNGQKPPIQPAVPTMGPTIVSGGANGASHDRKPSVTISASGPGGQIPNGGTSRAPSGLTFGAISGSPAPSHAQPQASLNPQQQNPRIASPAHSPSPIPAAQFSGGRPNQLSGGRPEISFGGESAEQNSRPLSMPPQAQHLRRESSQSAHSDMSNQAYNSGRGYPPQGGRGRGYPTGPYNPQMANHSPQPFRAMPNQPRGGMPQFQPQQHPNSPYRQAQQLNRSPAMTPANPAFANGPGYYPQHGYQPNAYGMPGQGQDPYYGQYYGQPGYGMQQSIHNPYVPASPGRGYPQQMPGPYSMPQPFVPPQGAQNMSRTPSNMSERPPSAVPQPSTPAMTNVNHVSHTPTPSVGTGASPGPNSGFVVPPKKKSAAIVIKNADGEVVNFGKTVSSPAPPAVSHPKSPAIVSTPTPPPRAPSAAESSHSRTESVAAKSAEEKRLEFVNKFKQQLNLDKEKGDADKKAAEEKEAKDKADAEAKALQEKEEAEAKAAKEKEEAEKAEKEAKEKEEAEAAEKAKKEAEEEEERLIAEMEEMERQEEERERAFQEKRKKEQEAKKAREAEDLKKEEERLRQLEREAEEREEARAKGESSQDTESAALFAGLKKNIQFGPGAMQTDSGSSTPEPAAQTPTQPAKATSATKQKPAPLHLQTNKAVEPPPMTAGMQSLKSARFLQVRDEAINYPDGFKSPNPALNMGAKKGRQYDKDFLLQFQEVFKEKPSVDWDMKLKETVGDSSDSAAPKSARPSSMMGARQPSRAGVPAGGFAMGSFASSGGRTLPPGTTSEQRFQQAQGGQGGQRGPTMTNPLAFVGQRGPGGSFPMAAPMARQGSYQSANMGPNSPRVGSSRGRGSRRGPSRKEEEKHNSQMPLTANLSADKLILEKSQSGWKPLSLVQSVAAGVPPSGHMPPDMVQRKVKAALNKMTPEKFDKIADQILEIAAQSKDETDGRTLRQVIQLTFEKACDEAHWASMYAKFAQRMLQTMSNDIKDDNVLDKHGAPVVGGALFRKYLLNRCQEEFERGWEVNLPEKPEGQTEVMLSDEYYVAAAAKRKGLGLIQFIGELYKLRMLTLRIMHECVLKLLDFEGLPDEGAIESLVKLIRTVGATMEKEEAGPKMLSVYFERIEKIMNMEGLNSRLKFMLLDILDLRRKDWDSKDNNKGPKTIAEIRQEAAAAQQAAEMERARTNQRGGGGPRAMMGRGDARSFSGGGMMPPQDYPSGRVQMDDLRKLSKGASGRNLNAPGALGPSMLGSRSSSGRRGLGPGGMMGRGDESNASSRTATPPQKEKESATHMNSFSALAALENEGAGEVGSPPSTASSPPVQKAAPAVEAKEAAPST